MTDVTPELLDTVAEWFDKGETGSAHGVAEGLRKGATILRVQADPDADLAAAIRNSYYNDGTSHLLVASRDPEQWLRMARAAREFLAAPQLPKPRVFQYGDEIPSSVQEVVNTHGTHVVRAALGGWWNINDEFYDRKRATEVEGWSNFSAYDFPLTEVVERTEAKRAPRVFRKGDPEPEDRDTIVLRTREIAATDGREPGKKHLELRYGNYASDGAYAGTIAWWQVTEDWHTWTSWEAWLSAYGPLAEVIEDAPAEPEEAEEEEVREPRVFDTADDVPDDVRLVRTDDGALVVRGTNPRYWSYSDPDEIDDYLGQHGSWDHFMDTELPLTEVFREEFEPAKREPRVFKAGDPEPEDKDGLILEGRVIHEDYFGTRNHVGEKARIQYLTNNGRYGGKAHTEWWQINDNEGERTYAAWTYWLATFGPFTEVIDNG